MVATYPYSQKRRSGTPKKSEPCGLTNRWSQPLAGVMTRFDLMKQFSMFATLAAASGGSARSR
jgi:hypothetical protein